MITYWHNPRCSKSRAGLAFFEDRGVTLTERRYLEDAPSREELAAVLAKLGVSAVQMMRAKDKLFKELGLSADMSEDQLLDAMAANPALIERPIAISGDKAAIGRPTEALGAVLE
ncbi:Arsenate reductase [Tritonibacter multivorans]|uniref:Arsenate reductase n=1 Tax=Tritonibacter multivorans TaxID=928856 RepID=A0A0P1GHS2_9RHOB|nr:arsenate reductase (glutaredoxin) [Tritonibacter multivorans]MDA7420585.1 arsenate reductase (glutaredoxin) [Tritonibacter multivorans]CUH81327.1 Arsenate reductase [Tritonibacter multivorans]SFC33029.1 arsenate reductase [Tritonibacter multivorans]